MRQFVEGIDDWPAWVTAAIILCTAIVALWTIRDARRTRYGQLITELSRQWSEPAAIESRGLYGKYKDVEITALVVRLWGVRGRILDPDDLRDWGKLSLWANRIEALGVLVSRKAIPADVVYDFWGGGIISAWAAWEEAVTKLRELDKESETFQHFEKLAATMAQIHEARALERRY